MRQHITYRVDLSGGNGIINGYYIHDIKDLLYRYTTYSLRKRRKHKDNVVAGKYIQQTGFISYVLYDMVHMLDSIVGMEGFYANW